MPIPAGGQVEVRKPQSSTPILRTPGRQVADAGRYEFSLTIGGRRLSSADAEVAADRQTDIAFVVADGILRMRLVNSDRLPIEDASDTIWEISPASGPTTQPMRLKGTRMNQVLAPGRYHVSIYTTTATAQREVTVEAGQEQTIDVPVPNH